MAIIASHQGGGQLADQPGARDVVPDAFGHFTFIGYSPEVTALLDAVGVTPDEACTEASGTSARSFVTALGALRHWARSQSLSRFSTRCGGRPDNGRGDPRSVLGWEYNPELSR